MISASNFEIVGHGGMGFPSQLPINSLESILSAVNIGVNGIEIDVQISKDGYLIAYHDYELNGNTKLNGFVNDYNAATILNTTYIDFPYANYAVRSLDQIFRNLLQHPDLVLYFDIKLFSSHVTIQYYDNFINALLDLIYYYNLQSRVVIESTDKYFLKRMHAKDYNLKYCYYITDFNDYLNFESKEILHAVLMRSNQISKTQTDILHQDNKRVVVWGINTCKDLQSAKSKNIDVLQVDHLRAVKKCLIE